MTQLALRFTVWLPTGGPARAAAPDAAWRVDWRDEIAMLDQAAEDWYGCPLPFARLIADLVLAPPPP